jgi:hypothetical protein
MSDRRFGFASSQLFQQHQQQQQQQNRCTLCLTEDDRNGQNTTVVCQHNASVESALHYLRNYGASYGSSPYQTQDLLGTTNNSAAVGQSLAFGGGCSPPVSPNYYTLAEFLLRMNRMQQDNGGGGGNHHHHQVRQPPPLQPPSGRPHKLKSEMGCLRECAFCKSNGETAEFYKSHFLKDPVGRVRCPILQRYNCALS